MLGITTTTMLGAVTANATSGSATSSADTLEALGSAVTSFVVNHLDGLQVSHTDIAWGSCLIALGLLACFVGYRLLKLMIILCGFCVAGFGAGFLFYTHATMADSQQRQIWTALVGAAAGFVGALIVLKLVRAGLFLIGSVLGFTVASAAIAADDGHLLDTTWKAQALTVSLAAIGGVILVLFEKAVFILATSTAGAFTTMAGVDRFVHSGLGDYVMQVLHGTSELALPPNCTEKCYGLLGGFVAMTLVGIVVQSCWARKRKNNTKYHPVPSNHQLPPVDPAAMAHMYAYPQYPYNPANFPAAAYYGNIQGGGGQYPYPYPIGGGGFRQGKE